MSRVNDIPAVDLQSVMNNAIKSVRGRAECRQKVQWLHGARQSTADDIDRRREVCAVWISLPRTRIPISDCKTLASLAIKTRWFLPQ